MTKLGFVVANGVGAAIAGAVGAAFASGNHPVVKGALTTGVVYALFSTVLVATDSVLLGSGTSGTVSGAPRPLRFL